MTAVPSTDKSRELKLRIISALIGAPIVLVITWMGGPAFAVLVVACGVVMASEWATIVMGRSWSPLRILQLSLVGLAVAAFAWTLSWAITVIAVAAAIVVAGIEARGRSEAGVLRWAPWGPVYAALPSMALEAIRAAPSGLMLVVFLFAVVWSTDIAAFFTGRALGGPKLWPAVSPKKTWSGALGGLAAAAIAGMIVAQFAGAERLWPVFLVGAVLSIASQAGDLFESSLKRRFGVKDSGWIIPGHGGLLDRVDGLVAAALGAAIVAAVNGGLSAPAGGLLHW